MKFEELDFLTGRKNVFGVKEIKVSQLMNHQIGGD
jgi:hypothetical protein